MTDTIIDIKNKEIGSVAEKIDEIKIRPNTLESFVGQSEIKHNVKVFIDAAKMRKKHLDHVLLYGPPGLGKTTFSNIIASEMGVGIQTTAGPMLSKVGDLAAILTNLKPNDVLFIDEIHRMPITVEETLYSAMEDFRLDIIIGEGPMARVVKVNIAPFTLIGATTRMGLISNPLRSRFGILLPLSFYNFNELSQVITRCCKINNITINQDAAHLIATRSRGTPRIAIRIAKRVSDFAIVAGEETITTNIVNEATKKMGIDTCGLDANDIRYLSFIAEKYNGGPVGIDTISAGMSEDRGAVEETIEAYLIKEGFVEKTPRGRVLTPKAVNHIANY